MAAVAHDDIGTAPPPSELRILQQGRVLQLHWPDRGALSLAAATLRRLCRCAECTSIRRSGRALETDPGVAIVDLQPIGAGASNLHFSDDHRRGIFPFAWLAALDDEALRDGVAS